MTPAAYERLQDSAADVLWRPDLIPPMRWVADFVGDPHFHRSSVQQREYESLLATAEVLYGIPDSSPGLLARTVAANTALRWVQTMAAGGGAQVRAAHLSNEDLQRIRFTTSAGVHGIPLSEYALFGALAGLKNLPRLQTDKSAAHWPDRWPMSMLSGATVLVVGLGGIGRATASMFAALGARVIGVNRSGKRVRDVDRVGRLDDLPQMFAESDVVILSLPSTAAVEDLVDARLLSHLRPGATIVNVGRGTVIDEGALLDALDTGRVGFAALDVVRDEPLAVTSRLWLHPRVLISPHNAAMSTDEERLIVELFHRNLQRYLTDQPLINQVDTLEFY